jgi:polar amino acid transport system permease protein
VNVVFGFKDFVFLLTGLKWTVLLSLIAFTGGGIMGLLVAVARTARSAALRRAMILYIAVFQGTPLLMQLFVVYYGLGLVGIQLPAWAAVVSRLRDVILPQALRIAQPATVGYAVQLIKGTSLAAIVGFIELARAGQIVSSQTFAPILVFGIVGAIYFALCWPLSLYSARLEAKYAVAR